MLDSPLGAPLAEHVQLVGAGRVWRIGWHSRASLIIIGTVVNLHGPPAWFRPPLGAAP